MTDLDNIWKDESAAGKELPEEKLLAYLEGRLTGDELREVEEWLSNEGIESDAIEGLQELRQGEAQQITSKLNNQLQGSLKKKRRKRRGMMEHKWSWIAICVILLLAVLGFGVIFLMR